MLDPMLTGALLAVLTALALAWKWKLGVLRVAIAVAICAAISVALVAGLAAAVHLDAIVQAGAVWLVTLGLGLSALAYSFYRDPERTGPDDDDVIVSPADGRIITARATRWRSSPRRS
jgi:phosphatidylserine decarboxylase